jgi:hypothetical protein
MLHFDREPVSRPHLVALDGAPAGTAKARLRLSLPVVLVVAATLLAVVVDLVDHTPAWSPYAAATSVLVLTLHALLATTTSRSR